MTGCILQMSMVEFFNEFSDRDNIDKYTMLLISRDITPPEHQSVTSLPSLIPNQHVLSLLYDDNDVEEYRSAYFRTLSNENNLTAINTIMKYIVEKNGRVILICSHSEILNGKYLQLLSEFISEVYDIKVHTCKTFKEIKDNIFIQDMDKLKKNIAEVTEHILKIKREKEKEKKLRTRELETLLDYTDEETVKELCLQKGILLQDDLNIDQAKEIFIAYCVEYEVTPQSLSRLIENIECY